MLLELIARNFVSVFLHIRIQAPKIPQFRILLFPHLSNTHQAYSSLVEKVAELVNLTYWAGVANFLSGSFASVPIPDVAEQLLESAHFNYFNVPIPSVTKQLKQMTRECKHPSRCKRLCDQLGVIIGVFRTTTFEADGMGGFIIEQKSRLHADRPGAKVTGSAGMGLQPNVSFRVEKNSARLHLCPTAWWGTFET